MRHALHLTRLVLVWFALSVGVAIASPMVNPQTMDLVCTSTGSMKLVVQGDDADVAATSHTLDCPLCATLSAPPALSTSLTQPAPSSLAHALEPLAAAHIASVTAPPMPSRGPPALSL